MIQCNVTVIANKLTVEPNEAMRMAQPQIKCICSPLRNNYFLFLLNLLAECRIISTENINKFKNVHIILTSENI